MKRGPLVLSIAMFVVFCVPIITLILTAASGIWQFPAVLPKTMSVRAFDYLWLQRGAIGKAIVVSFLYSITTVLFTFLISVFPAALIARRSFRGKAIVESLLLAPALVPAITFAVGVHILFLYLRLVDSFIGIVLMLSVFSYPYMLRALIAGYGVCGEEYTICAQNLGSSRLRSVLRVEVPILVPSIISGGTIVFLVAFSDYFLVFLIGGGAVPSLTGMMFPFLNSADRQIASAFVLLFLIVPILLFYLVDTTVRRRYRSIGFYTEDGNR